MDKSMGYTSLDKLLALIPLPVIGELRTYKVIRCRLANTSSEQNEMDIKSKAFKQTAIHRSMVYGYYTILGYCINAL